MWELKAALAAFLILVFIGIVRIVTPSYWRYAMPHTAIAVAYLLIGITIGVLVTSLGSHWVIHEPDDALCATCQAAPDARSST